MKKIRSLAHRLTSCKLGFHAWGVYSWFPTLGAACLMCGDCGERAWVYEGEI